MRENTVISIINIRTVLQYVKCNNSFKQVKFYYLKLPTHQRERKIASFIQEVTNYQANAKG